MLSGTRRDTQKVSILKIVFLVRGFNMGLLILRFGLLWLVEMDTLEVSWIHVKPPRFERRSMTTIHVISSIDQ